MSESDATGQPNAEPNELAVLGVVWSRAASRERGPLQLVPDVRDPAEITIYCAPCDRVATLRVAPMTPSFFARAGVVHLECPHCHATRAVVITDLPGA